HYLPEDMPIEVFVPRPDVPDGAALQEAARRAFMAWEEAAPDIVDFAFVEQPEADALAVVWKELGGSKAGSYRYAYSVLPGSIYRYRATEVWLDPRFGREDTFRFALLEVGHALGLFGRSPFRGDALSQVPSGEISARDVATLRALYGVPSGTVVNR
ncbi:MAG TPA: hypothetical protein VF171_02740, partial [Trueperaceae bacterium]